MKGFWQDAHVAPSQIHRGSILKEEGTQLDSDNLQEAPDTEEVKLHIAGFRVTARQRSPDFLYR